VSVRNPSPVLTQPGYGVTIYKSTIDALNCGFDKRVFKIYCRWTSGGALIGCEAYYRNGRTCPPALYEGRPALAILIRNAQREMHPEHVTCTTP
jgi:hypothetical protein